MAVSNALSVMMPEKEIITEEFSSIISIFQGRFKPKSIQVKSRGTILSQNPFSQLASLDFKSSYPISKGTAAYLQM
jgi:hypothetical protein